MKVHNKNLEFTYYILYDPCYTNHNTVANVHKQWIPGPFLRFFEWAWVRGYHVTWLKTQIFEYNYLGMKLLFNIANFREGIKPRTEWNGTRSNCCTIRTRTPDVLQKVGVNMPGLSMDRELILHPVPATKTGEEPSRQHRATPRIWNILAVYLESSSGVPDLSLTNEGSAMSLLSLVLDSAMGSKVNYSVAQPGTARQWYRILYSTHTRKQVPPESVRWPVNIQQARLVVGSPKRCITDI